MDKEQYLSVINQYHRMEEFARRWSEDVYSDPRLDRRVWFGSGEVVISLSMWFGESLELTDKEVVIPIEDFVYQFNKEHEQL